MVKKNGSCEERDRLTTVTMIPGRLPLGEKRSLEVDEGQQHKKQCTSERDEKLLSLPPPLLDDNDEILWCELMKLDDGFIEEWEDELEDSHVPTTE